MRHLTASLLAFLAVVWVASVAHAAGPTTLPLLAGQGDPCPGASVCAVFTGQQGYKAGGVVASTFTALPGLTVTANSFRYGENADGSLVGFAANLPRLTTRGLGVFEATTNLALQSQTIDNASWSKTAGSVTADTAVAPDGTTTAELWVPNTTNTVHFVSQSITVTNATAYTATAYMKAGGYTWGLVLTNTGDGTTFVGTHVNLATCTLGSAVGSPTLRTATAAVNGWCRVSVSFTANGTNAAVRAYPAIGDNLSSFAGDGVSGAYIWGADLRVGSYAVPYCPTTTVAATCAADDVRQAVTNPAVWTVFMQAAISAGTDGFDRRAYTWNDGSNVNRVVALSSPTNNASSLVLAANATQLSQSGPTKTGARTYASAIAYSGSAYRFVADGADLGAGVGSNSPTALSSFQFGSTTSAGGGNFFNGYIQRMAIYPSALSVAQLQELTNANNDQTSLNLNFASGVYKTTTPYVRTNLIPDSIFTVQAGGTLVSSTIDAPNGTNTAYRFTTVPGALNDAARTTSATIVGSTAYSGALWVRGAVGQTIESYAKRSTTGTLSNSAIQTITLTGAWQRVTNLTWTTAADNVAAAVYVRNNTTTTATSIDVWGGQLELGGYQTSSYLAPATSVATTQSTNPADVGALTFTNSTGGYVPWANGSLTLVGANTPRISDLGLLVEETRTNKSTNFNVNPQSTTNVTKSGDAAGVLSVVDDSVALAGIGLTGNAFKLDCALGAAPCFAGLGGQTGNTNQHTVSAYMRGGSGSIYLSNSAVAGSALTAGYTRYTRTVTPGASTNGVVIRAESGTTVYFILNQLEEGAFVTSPIPITGASASRSADVFNYTGLSQTAPYVVGLGGYGSPTSATDYANTGTLTNGAGIYTSPLAAWVREASVTTANVSAGSAISSGTPFNFAARYQANATNAASNGTLGTQDTSVTPPTLANLAFGNGTTSFGGGGVNITVRQAVIYPFAANDNELQYRSAGSW